jgi:hypothetical protein
MTPRTRNTVEQTTVEDGNMSKGRKKKNPPSTTGPPKVLLEWG